MAFKLNTSPLLDGLLAARGQSAPPKAPPKAPKFVLGQYTTEQQNAGLPPNDSILNAQELKEVNSNKFSLNALPALTTYLNNANASQQKDEFGKAWNSDVSEYGGVTQRGYYPLMAMLPDERNTMYNKTGFISDGKLVSALGSLVPAGLMTEFINNGLAMTKDEFLDYYKTLSEEQQMQLYLMTDYSLRNGLGENEDGTLNYAPMMMVGDDGSEVSYDTWSLKRPNTTPSNWWTFLHQSDSGTGTGGDGGSGYGSYGYGYGGSGGGGGSGNGTGGKWGEFDYDVEGSPEWWSALKPDKVTEQSKYLAMLNMLIPFLSPEDQQTMAKYLYEADPVTFAHYDPEIVTNASLIPGQINSGILQQFTGSDRATAALGALTALLNAMGKSEKDLGPGYQFLRNILASMQGLGGQNGNMITRTQYAQLLGAIDPLMSGAKASDKVSPYAPLAQMLAQPFFSAGKLMAAGQGDNGQWYFGAPNSQLY